jgi:hypothetical protein
MKILLPLLLLTGCATTSNSSLPSSWFYAGDIEARAINRCQQGENMDYEMAKLKGGDRNCVVAIDPNTEKEYPTALMCDKKVGDKVFPSAYIIEYFEARSDCEKDYVKTLKSMVKFDIYARDLTDMGLTIIDSFDDLYNNLNIKVRR